MRCRRCLPISARGSVVAPAGHIGLYLLMLGSTLTGWALAGTFRTPITDVVRPDRSVDRIRPDRAMHGLFEESHMIAAYLLAALVVVHMLAHCAIILSSTTM